jgi:hypothetical protein
MDEFPGHGAIGRPVAVGPARPVDLARPAGGSVLERTVAAVLEAYRTCAHPVENHPVAAAPSADDLAAAMPGPPLARLLDAVDPAALDTDAQVEAVAAWERLGSWVAARQGELVAALEAREHRAGRGEFAADAIATRLGVSRRAAMLKVELASDLTQNAPIAEALRRGDLDVAKARVLAEEVGSAPAELRQHLLEDFVPRAPRMTGPQLRARMRRATQAMDPTSAVRRCEAEARRRAVRLTPAPDAMAYLTAYLPAVDATACMSALAALADHADPTDGRTLDARRADALSDLLRGVLDAGRAPDGTDLPARQRRRPHIQVTVAATTLLGVDDQPADLAGYGPIPASVARAVAQDGTWRALLVDEAGQVLRRGTATYRPGADLTGTVIARDATCRFPGCRVPAHRCDLDHVAPFDPTRPAANQTTEANLHALCRHHHRLKTHAGWTVERDTTTGRTAWTTPWGRTAHRDPDPPPQPWPSGRMTTNPSTLAQNPTTDDPAPAAPNPADADPTTGCAGPAGTAPVDLGPPPF